MSKQFEVSVWLETDDSWDTEEIQAAFRLMLEKYELKGLVAVKEVLNLDL